MRTIVFLVGMPGSGKSTWIKNNNLNGYVVNPDSIRVMLGGYINSIEGELKVNMLKDKKVWKLVFEIILDRMRDGGDIYLDATNLDSKSMSKLKNDIKKYKYSAYYKLFKTKDLNEDIRNNNIRPIHQKVPEEVLTRMRVKYDNMTIPKWIRPYDITKHAISYPSLNHIQNIYVIGDIHGNYKPLMNFLNSHLDKESLYIFVGDYIDRGPSNGLVVNKLMEIQKSHNCIFLEGNHERWLERWSKGRGEIRSDVFKKYTIPDLEKVCDVNKVKVFTKSLVPYYTFSYNNDNYIISHTGVATKDISTYSSEDMIKGVGYYTQLKELYNSFNNSQIDCKDNYINVHGHRNLDNLPIKIDNNNYNLEGEVFKEGYMRAIKINSSGITPLKFKSDYNFFTESLIDKMRDSKDIIENVFDHMSSFKFTRNAFYKGNWNDTIIRARGFFINNINNSVIARSYNKFFNINELEETQAGNLANTFTYPVVGYHKYNGSLGIISYDNHINKLRYLSKSTPNGEFADRVREKLIYLEDKLIDISKKYKASLVFEIIDPENDPHIINYKESRIILLDVIYNSFSYNKVDYEELKKIGKYLDIEVKKIEFILSNKKLFYQFINSNTSDNPIEGYVLEDSNNYLVKYKTEYYSKIKYLKMLSTYNEEWLKTINHKDLSSDEIREQYEEYKLNKNTNDIK